jgi:predicted NBD/HSP70 family sugar kinase
MSHVVPITGSDPFGGIEAGGTNWRCAVGTAPDDLRAQETIPTTTPQETIDRVVAFFRRRGFGNGNGPGRIWITGPPLVTPIARTFSPGDSSPAELP